MSYSKEELSRYRLARAKESVEEAVIMAQTGHWNTATSRLYYACFYAVSAYLILKDIDSSSHKGVKTSFNKELIKSGLLPLTFGQLYNNLFSLRQDVDYRDYSDVSKEKVLAMIKEVGDLIHEIEIIVLELQDRLTQ
jgi:uncharacterized protein (UPF0332 family)